MASNMEKFIQWLGSTTHQQQWDWAKAHNIPFSKLNYQTWLAAGGAGNTSDGLFLNQSPPPTTTSGGTLSTMPNIHPFEPTKTTTPAITTTADPWTGYFLDEQDHYKTVTDGDGNTWRYYYRLGTDGKPAYYDRVPWGTGTGTTTKSGYKTWQEAADIVGGLPGGGMTWEILPNDDGTWHISKIDPTKVPGYVDPVIKAQLDAQAAATAESNRLAQARLDWEKQQTADQLKLDREKLLASLSGPKDWIKYSELAFGKDPNTPKWLNKYTSQAGAPGNTVQSSNTPTPSGQWYNRAPASQKAMLGGYADWSAQQGQGMSWDDLLTQMANSLPTTQPYQVNNWKAAKTPGW